MRSKGAYKGIPLGVCFFPDDVVLVNKSQVRINRKLELWWEAIESNGFRQLDSLELKSNI
jgi:hypothetical protein